MNGGELADLGGRPVPQPLLAHPEVCYLDVALLGAGWVRMFIFKLCWWGNCGTGECLDAVASKEQNKTVSC